MYCDDPYSLNFGPNYGLPANQPPENLSRFTENWGNGSTPFRQSLVLDAEKEELVKASGGMGKKTGASETKTKAALKSHCEAERRRREKINAHFVKLRDLVPNNEKMDKAALLAEVINQVKELKTRATEASQGLHIPMDTDQVEVQALENNGSFLMSASLCCDYTPDLLSDVRQALSDLPVRVLKSEISTLGGRVKTVFLITTGEENSRDNVGDWEVLVSSVRVALSNILDKISASAEYAQELFLPRKRQRVSYFDSS